MQTSVKAAEKHPFLPRFGFTFSMPEDCEHMRYFGRGPEIDPKYRLDATAFTFAFRLTPTRTNDDCPFERCVK